MTEAILVINAGSSSIKFASYADNGTREPILLGKGQVEGLRSEPHFEYENANGELVGEHHWPAAISHAVALAHIIQWIEDNAPDVKVTAAGHRVVFGGAKYAGPTLLGDRNIAEIEELVPFFPLHLPHNLAAIRALAAEHANLPQVACFDNTFHATQPRVAQLFALPRQLTDQGIRRYGFHGLSYEYVARKLPEFAPEASRVVVAHLGSGASMCAIRDGRSIESTLGFSGLDGLPMGTRPGCLDSGVLLYLMQSLGMDAAAIENLLYRESGLLGVSGISNDMRTLLASDDPHAGEAIELFVYHIAKQLGALSAVLEGLDALVFTAGVGENAARIRVMVCDRAGWLGVRLDGSANSEGGPRISTSDSPVSAWVIPTDEERMIAKHTFRILAERTGQR
ncbi:MAG: acetate/propionate family kinase, partial [Rhodospirillales bacterium]|nr:acetate/propionate family kinase [Rhodospirillales bacterium]